MKIKPIFIIYFADGDKVLKGQLKKDKVTDFVYLEVDGEKYDFEKILNEDRIIDWQEDCEVIW